VVYISLGMRFVANVEALNMVETVGNITKHRRAPVVVKTGEGYSVKYVPAVSGESFAHAYQESLVKVAELLYNGDPPVCQYCKRGEFFKSMDVKYAFPTALEMLKRDIDIFERKFLFELETIKRCLVEDIGGFLYTPERRRGHQNSQLNVPVRRTSRFEVGYIIPVFEAIDATAIEPQLQARHAPSETETRTGDIEIEETEQPKSVQIKKPRAAQMIYYVETASALYGLSFNIDLDGIGRTSMVKIKDAFDDPEERIRRVKVALGALALTLTGTAFGAKRSRFLPISEIDSLVAVISRKLPFAVSSPVTRGYIVNTLRRVKSFKGLLKKVGIENELAVLVYGAEVENIERFDTPEDLMNRLLEVALNWTAQEVISSD